MCSAAGEACPWRCTEDTIHSAVTPTPTTLHPPHPHTLNPPPPPTPGLPPTPNYQLTLSSLDTPTPSPTHCHPHTHTPSLPAHPHLPHTSRPHAVLFHHRQTYTPTFPVSHPPNIASNPLSVKSLYSFIHPCTHKPLIL